jgi:TPR repeat protein
MIASVFDAAGEDERAIEWYSRSAARNYLPAMLQLLALR